MLERLEDRTVPSTFTVTSAADDGSLGTLRSALDSVNYMGGPSNTIVFAIGQPGSAQTIALNPIMGALPAVGRTVVIDGTTQGGASGALPLISVVGGGGYGGLILYGGGSQVLDLDLYGFAGAAVDLANPSGSAGDLVSGCVIGTDLNGDANVGNTTGVLVEGPNDVVGDATGVAKTIVSGNTQDGIDVSGANAVNDLITNVWVGLDLTGLRALGNGMNGISLMAMAPAGAGATVAKSVIAGQRGDSGNQIYLSGTNALVKDNWIGVGSDGHTAVGSHGTGVVILNGRNNTIGGTAAERNIIAGNSGTGVSLIGAAAMNNVVSGNYIGLDANGNVQPNIQGGVYISGGANDNTIGGRRGGVGTGSGNAISGNGGDGVVITDAGTSGNVLLGNFIGTDGIGATGKDGKGAATSNAGNGVTIKGGASGNTIGDGRPGYINVISGNTGSGVVISDNGTTKNVVKCDYIGTDVNGATAIANGGNGVTITNASGNTVGAPAAWVNMADATVTVISGNTDSGVSIQAGSQNQVMNSYIGTDVKGTTAIANHGDGVELTNQATNNTIGGLGSEFLNVISGNDGATTGYTGNGVTIKLSSTQNFVEGDYIGVGSDGTTALGNKNDGVYAQAGSNSNTIGGTAVAAKNVISSNTGWGVELASTGNLVDWDFIGYDVGGTLNRSNKGGGLTGRAGNTIGVNNRIQP